MPRFLSHILWFNVIVCKFVSLLVHRKFDKKMPSPHPVKMWAENFLFFSPKIYKIKKIVPEVKKIIKEVYIKTNDGEKLYCVYFPPKNNNPLVLFLHGQSENFTKWQKTILFLHEQGLGGFFLSYRGHYKSSGSPSEQNIYDDAEYAVNYLHSIGFQDENIVIWGRSLGSAVAIETSLHHEFKALIIESGILNIKIAALSMFKNYMRIFKLKVLGKKILALINELNFEQKFSNDRKIGNVKCPILIMHARNDVKVDFTHGQRLHMLNPKSFLYIAKIGSHDRNKWCFNTVKNFLKSLDADLPEEKTLQ